MHLIFRAGVLSGAKIDKTSNRSAGTGGGAGCCRGGWFQRCPLESSTCRGPKSRSPRVSNPRIGQLKTTALAIGSSMSLTSFQVQPLGGGCSQGGVVLAAVVCLAGVCVWTPTKRGGGGGRQNWKKNAENYVGKLRKMRQNMRRKMPFSCNGVCLPLTPMFVNTHVDLLTPSLFSTDYGPGSTCKALVGNHTFLLWFRRRGVTPSARSSRAPIPPSPHTPSKAHRVPNS